MRIPLITGEMSALLSQRGIHREVISMDRVRSYLKGNGDILTPSVSYVNYGVEECVDGQWVGRSAHQMPKSTLREFDNVGGEIVRIVEVLATSYGDGPDWIEWYNRGLADLCSC